ncbi:MBL fold metallo-hydrolase [Luminiphilus sp.]|nr:MBL fold metallo-hydrolase [Luminiphilus sp.]MDA9920216.1 MBL fold metallo-hydrolase [bacterium]
MFKHALLIFFALVIWLQAPTGLADDWRGSDITQLVMLGTGTPNPFPDRAGPSLAIVVNGEPYLVDFGPGVVRQASSLSPEYGGEIEGLAVENLKHAFLTHLHSDHTVGLPDLILTAWTVGRDSPLKLFGPEGTEHMADKVLEAYEEDIRYRLYSEQPANNQGWRVETQEVTESGLIFKDENVTVEAFRVPHGSWPDAWGYRFTTPDRVIVVSGDTAPSRELAKYARGADILVHEVYSQEGFAKKEPQWQKYHAKNHTSTSELGRLASEVKPKLLVLYHQLLWGSTHDTLLEEVKAEFSGEVVSARDLDVF